MSLFEDLKPFLKVARIFGFAPYTIINHNLSLSRWGIVYSGFCTVIYSYLFYLGIQRAMSVDVENKLRFLTVFRIVLLDCVIFVDIFVCIICHRKLEATLALMQRYDNSVKFDTTRRVNSIRSWIGLVAIAMYFVLLGWITYMYETQRALESSIIYVILYTSTAFSILKFSAIVASLLHRFRHLNRMLKTTDSTGNQIVIGWSRRQLNLRDARCLHNCLVAAAEELNSLYTGQLLLWVAGLTFNVISRIYVFCEPDGFHNFPKVLHEGGIAAAFIFLLVVLVGICHITAAEANKVGAIAFSPISSVYRRPRNSEIEESIRMGLYFLFRRFNFSAASGFIQVDLPLLQTIAGTMTTYLVILKAPG